MIHLNKLGLRLWLGSVHFVTSQRAPNIPPMPLPAVGSAHLRVGQVCSTRVRAIVLTIMQNLLMTGSVRPQILSIICITTQGCYSWLTIGHFDSSVSRNRSLRAAADDDGLVAQWQRSAGMPTVVWSHGLYLCCTLFPPSCPPPGCLSHSLSSSHPPSLSSLLFFHCLRKGSSCASVDLRSALVSVFCSDNCVSKNTRHGGPPPDTLTPGRIVNSVAPYITRSCGGSGASLEASEEWGTCRSSSAETFSTRRQKFLTHQGQKVMFLLNVATLTHLGKTTELNWFEKLWRFRLKNIFYLKT